MTFVDVTTSRVENAGELAEQGALRGYDAVHLATALVSGSEAMLAADADLLAAAEAEGLLLIDVRS